MTNILKVPKQPTNIKFQQKQIIIGVMKKIQFVVFQGLNNSHLYWDMKVELFRLQFIIVAIADMI